MSASLTLGNLKLLFFTPMKPKEISHGLSTSDLTMGVVLESRKSFVDKQQLIRYPKGSLIAIFLYINELPSHDKEMLRDAVELSFLIGLKHYIKQGKFRVLGEKPEEFLIKIEEKIKGHISVSLLTLSTLELSFTIANMAKSKLEYSLISKANLLRIEKKRKIINAIISHLGKKNPVRIVDRNSFFHDQYHEFFPHYVEGYTGHIRKRHVFAVGMDICINDEWVGVTFPWTFKLFKRLSMKDIKELKEILEKFPERPYLETPSVRKLYDRIIQVSPDPMFKAFVLKLLYSQAQLQIACWLLRKANDTLLDHVDFIY